MRTRLSLIVLSGLWLGACEPQKPVTPPTDVPVDPPGEYDGTSVGGVIPDQIPREGYVTVDDAGAFEVDTTCCALSLSVTDQEPADAVGRLTGGAPPFNVGQGISVVRDGGTWTASACVPVHTATAYWFEFTWFDADAGFELDGGPALVTEVRADSSQALDYGPTGAEVNFYAAKDTCN